MTLIILFEQYIPEVMGWKCREIIPVT